MALWHWLVGGVAGYLAYKHFSAPSAASVLRTTKLADTTEVLASKQQLASVLTSRGWTVGGLPVTSANLDVWLDSTNTNFTLAIASLDLCTKSTLDALVSCANTSTPMQL